MASLDFTKRGDPLLHPVTHSLKFYDGEVIPLTLIEANENGDPVVKDQWVMNFFTTDTTSKPTKGVYRYGQPLDITHKYVRQVSNDYYLAFANLDFLSIDPRGYIEVTDYEGSFSVGLNRVVNQWGLVTMGILKGNFRNYGNHNADSINDLVLYVSFTINIDTGLIDRAGSIYFYTYGDDPNYNIFKYFTGCTVYDYERTPITPWEEEHSTTGGGGGTSGSGEGTGIKPSDSDEIGEPSPYLTDALLGGSSGAGFLTAFIPSKSDLENLGSILWARVFSEDWTDRVFQGLQKPMDYIAGLSIMPIPVPTSGTKQIRFGGIVIDQSAPSLPLASSQYPEFDCGEVKIEEYWGSALDYAPYTKISIFLPFIGTRELDTDEVMNKTMKVVYHFDIVGGVCSAMILLDGTVYYQFSGSCSQVVPLNARDYTSIATAGVQMAISAVGAVAAVASGAGAMATAGAIGASVGSAFNTIQSKPNIQHAGAVSGNAGMIGVLTPYLIVHRPKQSLAQGYNEFEGYPSNIATTLGNCRGYTKVESIHLDGVPATDTELEEIERRLKEGVLI